MSYLVLARKYRPKTFAEVTGQEICTRTLQGAISEERIAHAYLLCGPRGTGKTTTARLFAKALNCEKGPTIDPCGTCARCQAADAGNETDLIEIDAASHTGVDHVRELRAQAAYAPLAARFKIYLIDEAHMLSKPAFNALLKTLEEPPPHVKFLFATTEPHKLPDTILSRCQVLKLQTLSEEAIEERLDEVFRLEGVRAADGVCAALARRARGGMRDALSLADQLLALVGDAPSLADTERLAAGADREAIESLMSALVDGDRGLLLTQLGAQAGGERELVEALLTYLRGCLLCALCGADNPLTQAPADSRAAMAQLAKQLGGDRIEWMMEDLLHARERMRTMPGQAPVILELTLLQLARPASTIPIAELAERLLRLEQRLAAEPLADPPAPPAAPRAATQPAAPQRQAAQGAQIAPQPPSASRQRPQFAGAVRSSKVEAWKRFTQDLTDRAPALGNVLSKYGKLLELNAGKATVGFVKLRQADRPLVHDARNQKLCSKVFSELMGETILVRLEDGSTLAPGDQDKFTAEVKGLFGGRIED